MPGRTAVFLIAALLVPAQAQAQVQAQARQATRAQDRAGATMVVIVRHAEKAAEPAADPPLSAEGQARAHALAEALQDAGVTAILVTPYERTRATARPLAALLGITPEEVPVGRDIAAHISAVVEAVKKHEGGTVLVVGHSNTVPLIAEALSGQEAPALTDADYDPLFTVILGGPAARLMRTRYGPS